VDRKIIHTLKLILWFLGGRHVCGFVDLTVSWWVDRLWKEVELTGLVSGRVTVVAIVCDSRWVARDRSQLSGSETRRKWPRPGVMIDVPLECTTMCKSSGRPAEGPDKSTGESTCFMVDHSQLR